MEESTIIVCGICSIILGPNHRWLKRFSFEKEETLCLFGKEKECFDEKIFSEKTTLPIALQGKLLEYFGQSIQVVNPTSLCILSIYKPNILEHNYWTSRLNMTSFTQV